MHSSQTQYTGAANHAAVTQFNQTLKPEWLRVTEAVRLFGIGRSSLYELIAAGKIKSACIRKRGSVRGRRLLSYDSLAAFVENAASKGGASQQ